MQIYSKSQKECFFISQPILIWFALSHRANWGLQFFFFLCPFQGIKFLFFDQ